MRELAYATDGWRAGTSGTMSARETGIENYYGPRAKKLGRIMRSQGNGSAAGPFSQLLKITKRLRHPSTPQTRVWRARRRVAPAAAGDGALLLGLSLSPSQCVGPQFHSGFG